MHSDPCEWQIQHMESIGLVQPDISSRGGFRPIDLVGAEWCIWGQNRPYGMQNEWLDESYTMMSFITSDEALSAWSKSSPD